MPHTVATLPEKQRAALAGAYDQAVAARRLKLVLGLAAGLLALSISVVGAEVEPVMLWTKLGNFTSYFDRLLTLDTGARVWTDPADWFWGLHRWLRLLGETVLIAYVGTFSGTMIAFAACFVASRNLVRSALMCMAVRRVLELLRTVPDIVFAMVFVVAFGLGPLPGVLALTLHSTGTLGKLFTEAVESIDMSPVEGVTAAGGGWLSRVRFGALPQVLSTFASYTLLRLEINVRGATVIGFVGAGGIGEDLLIAIRKFYYQDVSAMLLLIVACVMLWIWHPNGCAIACWRWSRAMSELRAALPGPRRRRGAAAAHARHDGAAARRTGVSSPMLAGLVVLGVTPDRILARLGRLGDIFLLMLPPSPGSMAHFWIYLGALGADTGDRVSRHGWRRRDRIAAWFPRRHGMSLPGESCISWRVAGWIASAASTR